MARTRMRKWLKRAGLVLLGVLAPVVLALLSLTLPPVRSQLVRLALDAAHDALPGRLEVGDARWLWPLRIELDDIVWTHRDTLLVSARRVRLDPQLARLWSRDLVVEEIRLENLRADVPRLTAALATEAAVTGAADDSVRTHDAASIPLLRAGALPGLPSVEVPILAVDVVHAALTAADTLRDFRLEARIDLLAGHAPIVDVTHLSGALPARGVEVHPGRLRIDLQQGTVDAALDGRLGQQSSFELVSRASESERFELELRLPELQAGARILGRWSRQRNIPVGLAFEGTLWPPAPEALGVAAPVVLDSLTIDFRGQLDFEDEPSGYTLVEVAAQNDWFESIVVPARFGPEGPTLENLRVRLAGLALEADASLRDGQLRAAVNARVTGTEWLRAALGDSVTLPDSVDVACVVEASGAQADPAIRIRVAGALQQAGVAIDSLGLVAAFDAGVREAMRFDLGVVAESYTLATGGQIRLPLDSRPLQAELRPLGVHARGSGPAVTPSGGSARPASIEFDPRTGAMRVERLQVVGDLGHFEVHANLDSEAKGAAQLAATWPEPPLLPSLPAALAESLRAAWPRDFVPGLLASAELDSAAAEIQARVVLPGPEHLRSWLPGGLDVTGLGALHAQLGARVADTMSGHVDLGATSWLDTCRVEWSRHGERVALENLQLRFEGLAVDANATLAGSQLQGRLDVAAREPALLQRLPMQDELGVTLTSRVDVSGTRQTPHIVAATTANGRFGAWSVPALEATADWILGRSLDLVLSLPQGFATSAVAFALDKVELRYSGLTNGDATYMQRGHLQLDARGADVALRQTATLDISEDVEAQYDSLYLRLGDRDLTALKPFQLAWHGATGELVLRDLELEGTMGRVMADVLSTPDSLALVSEVDARFPAKPKWLAAPKGVWPTRLQVSARGAAHDEVQVESAIEGFRLANRSDVRLAMELKPNLDGFESRLAVAGPDTLLVVSAILPLRFDQFPIRSHTVDDSLRVDARWQRIPIPVPPNGEGLRAFFDEEPPEWQPTFAGQLRIQGTGATPELAIDGEVHFPEGALENHVLLLEVRGRGVERTRATLDLVGFGRKTFAATLDVPLRFSLAPFSAVVAEEELQVRVRADSLDVAELNPLMPAGTSATGIIDADLRLEGVATDPRFAGHLDIDDLQMDLPRRSFIKFNLETTLAGTKTAPEIRGTLRVGQARLRVPERDRSLHPTDGAPILWREVAAPDSVWRQPAPDTARAAFQLPEGASVQMRVDVPSGFWILGNELGIELKGDLDVGLQERKPAVQGRLEAVQGWFVLMGRQFTLQRGVCDFTGVNALNPALDIEMRTEVGGAKIFVTLRGDVEKPELVLRSDPDMAEGDIISTLVFGQPADKLGSGEGDFLAAQAAALAQSYSGAALQQVLGEQLGIDTVRFKSRTEGSSNAGAGTSLEVGKYLTPEILVQYEIDLQTGQGLGVSLEYRLSQRLRLNTHFSQIERSGIELNWSKDY